MKLRSLGLSVVVAFGLLAAPLAAEAQQAGKVARVGYLGSGAKPSPAGEAFKATLREHGWVEGQNLSIEYRFGGEKYEGLRALADELVRLKVDVIFATNAPAARAAKEATSTTPIVFSTPNDPVRMGLVASFAHPGGNITGVSGFGPELDQKRVQLLKEVVPSLTLAMILLNPSNPMTPQRLTQTETAARALKVKVRVVGASDARKLDTAFDTIARVRPAGLIVYEDPMFYLQEQRIIEFAAKQRIPAIYTISGSAQQGGLMDYAPNFDNLYRAAASYVNRILRGAKPSDLPVDQPTKFELVINLKTAKALGLTIPQSVLLRADQLIE